MTIHIEELTFNTIIGILEFERITPQKIIINMEIEYLYENNHFINYADVIKLIEKQMLEKKYELLETAIDELTKDILLKYPQIQQLTLKIMKPNIMKNAKVALSSTWSKIQNQ
jgi:dihydroneopterin aldolase